MSINKKISDVINDVKKLYGDDIRIRVIDGLYNDIEEQSWKNNEDSFPVEWYRISFYFFKCTIKVL